MLKKKNNEWVHTTKDGKEIPLSAMESSHIQNTIRIIERKAEEGITIEQGGGSGPDDFWYDKETLHGKEAREYLKHSVYVEELYRRLPPPFQGFRELRRTA